MKTSFTPGPWHIEVMHCGSDSTDYTISAGTNAHGDGPAADICKVYASDANARLIAAAPKMYAALQEILAINDEDQGAFNKRGGTRRGLSIVTAQAALAEAAGETA